MPFGPSGVPKSEGTTRLTPASFAARRMFFCLGPAVAITVLMSTSTPASVALCVSTLSSRSPSRISTPDERSFSVALLDADAERTKAATLCHQV